MIRQKIVVVIVTMLLAAGFLTVMGQSAAAAESDLAVAPIALGACDVHRPGGGWDERNRVSEGTATGTDELPVRAKNLRLGEPCVQSGSLMYLPLMFTEVPQDGEQGSPAGGDGFVPAVVVDPTCPAETLHGRFHVTVGASNDYCGTGANYGTWELDVEFSSGGATVDVEWTRINGSGPQGGQALHWYCYVPPGDPSLVGSYVRNYTRITENNGVISPGWGVGSGGVQTLGVTASRQFSCASGTLARVFVAGATAPVNPWDSLRGWWSMIVPGAPGDVLGDGIGYWNGTQGAQFHITGNTHSPLAEDEPGPLSMMYCRSDPGDVGTRFAVELVTSHAGFFGGSVPVVVEEEVVWSGWAETAVMSPDIAGCGYLEAIELVICDPLGSGTNVWACLTHTWTADRWRDAPPYGDDGDPTITLCELTPWIPECIPVLFPPFFDPIDFAVVCADPPETTWEVWDWLGPFLAHYAECLFVPQGGFDRHGKISAAWEGTAGGALASAAVTVLDAFYFEGSCGPLVAVVPLGGADVSINTCTWSWAGQLKIALGWLVILLGAWRAVGFAIAIVQSAIGASKMPNPVGDDD